MLLDVVVIRTGYDSIYIGAMPVCKDPFHVVPVDIKATYRRACMYLNAVALCDISDTLHNSSESSERVESSNLETGIIH